MSIFTKALVGLAAALLVIVGGASLLGSRQAIGGPSPSPAATPRQLGSPMPEPPLDRTFTSPIYDFVVHYPSAWRTIPATHPWTKAINSASDIPFWGDTALDALQGSDIRLVVWAQSIPQATGLTQAQAADLWVRNLHIGNGPCVGDSELPRSFAAGGGQAYTIINGCGPSTTMGIVRDGVMYEVAVVLDGVGWDFTFDGRVDAPYALAVLTSVSLPSGGLNVASPAPTTSPGA